MDLSKLSDADLMALSNKQYDKLSNEGLAYLHNQSNGVPSAPDNAHSPSLSGKQSGTNTVDTSSDWWKKSTSERIQEVIKHPSEAFKQHNTAEQNANPALIPQGDDISNPVVSLTGPESGVSLVKSVPKLGNALTEF